MSNYLPFTRPTIDEDTIESVGAETANFQIGMVL